MLHSDGTPCKIPPPPNGDATGLAGAGGGKSSTKDMLLLYKAMLAAHRHQVVEATTSTPGLPFRQMQTIFEKQVATGTRHISEDSYTLGWVRTKLPGKLGLIGMNEVYLGHDKMPVIGSTDRRRVVLHHNGNLVGALSSVHLLPDTETAIIVMCNSLAFTDPTDFVGQLILETVLGGNGSTDFVSLSKASRAASFQVYTDLIAELENGKTDKPPSQSLSAYEGKYYNKAGNFLLEVYRNEDNTHLRMMSQNLDNVVYDLLPYDGDTFYWPADRDKELCEYQMFPWTWPGVHKVTFAGGIGGGITQLAWQHDPATVPEIFQKAGGFV